MRRSILSLSLAALVSLALSPAPAAANDAAKTAALAKGLATRRLKEVKFEGAKLADVLRYLRIATGWNFVVKHEVLKKAQVDEDAITAKVELADVTVGTFLGLVLEPHGLVAKPVGNIVFVTTKADAMGKPVVVLHPISHITWKKTDFIGPKIDLHPSDYRPEEEPTEVPVEDDPLTDPAHVVDLVKTFVDEAWDTEGWSISANQRFMTVKAPRPVQARVVVALAVIASMK